MLSFWRKRSKTLVVHLVFWPIIAVFVIWGFEKFGSESGGAAATVGRHTIAMAEYRNALQRIIEFYNQMMQGNFDENAQRQFRVRETALQQLVNSYLISEEAAEMGIDVTDTEIRSVITEIPALKKDGRFSRENYEGLLRYYRTTASQFESGIKKDTVLDKTRKLFENGVRPSQSALDKEKQLRSQKINLEFLRLDRDDISKNISVSEAEINEFLNGPQQKEVKEYFDLHKSEFSKEEQVRARHILIKAKKGDAKEEEVAKKKIAEAQKELTTKSFEEVAKKYSDDPGSKAKGGDLDWFTRGRMVPEFENEAFKLDIGKVSSPVQSSFGYHIIKVEAKKAAEATTYDQAKNSIASKKIIQRKADARLLEFEKKLSQDANGAVKEIQDFRKDAKWEETGLFSLADDQIPKIGESEDLNSVAFGLSPENPVAKKIVKVGETSYLLRFKKAEAVPVLDSLVKDDLFKNAGRTLFSSWSAGLMDKAKTDGSVWMNPAVFAEPE